MPQHTNADPSDDLPLDQDPSTWVPGFPDPSEFASFDRLDLTLRPDDGRAVPADLHEKDAKEWGKVRQSTPDGAHVRWIPGTKVIGAVTFGSGDGFAPISHGVGTSSVSVGNLHGSCPSCLLVFVDGMSEEANRWVEEQDWIDLQTNSWGASWVTGRHRVYAGSDTDAQRDAVDRGQAIFFSAGNGVDGAFVASNPTLFSSQEGPDWIITVGAIMPDGSSTGHGKPADVASLGTDYPSAGGETVTDESTFGGTSNATPVTAGMYGEALYRLRRMLSGASRVQEGGVIATGPPGCESDNPQCALSDGQLTVHEMREALFRSATYTEQGWSVSDVPPGGIPGTNGPEQTFLAEGHGSYRGLFEGRDTYEAEVARIVGYASGAWHEDQPEEQALWFVADSLCRQGGWGAWDHGYAQSGVPTPPRSNDWPMRSWLAHECPPLLGAAVAAERQLQPFMP